MKTKVSLTIDKELVGFVDNQPGASRSDKIESIVRQYREARRDAQLRKELAAFNASSHEEAESEAWRNVMEEAQWSESGEATSGRSRSPRSRNRDRR